MEQRSSQMNAEKYARWEMQDRKMRVVGKVIAYLTVALLALTFYMAFDQNAAMKQCQAKGFSYDTCFHSLNR
jgi:hypothetical protein